MASETLSLYTKDKDINELFVKCSVKRQGTQKVNAKKDKVIVSTRTVNRR